MNVSKPLTLPGELHAATETAEDDAAQTTKAVQSPLHPPLPPSEEAHADAETGAKDVVAQIKKTVQPTLQPSRLPRFLSASPEHAGAYTGEKDVAQTKTATLNKNIPRSPFVPESVHPITSEDFLEPPKRQALVASLTQDELGATKAQNDVALPALRSFRKSLQKMGGGDAAETKKRDQAYPSPFSVEDSTETRAMTYEELREALAQALETVDLMQAYQVLIIPPFFL